MGIVERGAAIVFAKWLQVQLVEQVEEVDAQIQLGTLALEEGHRRGFSKASVDGLVPRSPEGISVEEWGTNNTSVKIGKSDVSRTKRLAGSGADATAALGDDPWELTVVSLECVGAEIILCTAEVRGHESGTKGAGGRSRRAIVALDGRPW